MARFSLLSGTLLAALCLFGGRYGFAQAQAPDPSTTNAEPVTDAPPPAKKRPAGSTKPAGTSAGPAAQDPAAAAPASSSATGSTANAKSDSKDSSPASRPSSSPSNDNAFPEDLSRRAAEGSQAASPSPAPSADSSAAKPDTQTGQPAGGANPFPEDVSRQAEKAARDAGKTDEPPLPSGVSSSQSSGIVDGSDSGLSSSLSGGDTHGGTLQVTNPSRASKDTQVGDFYLQREDAKGAYLRYQDAIRFDPTNVDAIFGIAEAARLLGKPAEAVRNYQLYLDILPNGPKSKRALKQLQALSKTPQNQGH